MFCTLVLSKLHHCSFLLYAFTKLICFALWFYLNCIIAVFYCMLSTSQILNPIIELLQYSMLAYYKKSGNVLLGSTTFFLNVWLKIQKKTEYSCKIVSRKFCKNVQLFLGFWGTCLKKVAEVKNLCMTTKIAATICAWILVPRTWTISLRTGSLRS